MQWHFVIFRFDKNFCYPWRVNTCNRCYNIISGARAPAFVAAVPQWPLHQDDGALLHRPPLTPRPPGCPLECGLGRTGISAPPAPRGAWGFHRSPPLAGKCSGAPAPHNRSHPWRDNKERAINRASTMEHPAMVETSRFMINVLL